MTSYNQFIFEMTRSVDPELAEDLNRRMTVPLRNTFELSAFVNDIMMQYPQDWTKPWFVTTLELTIEQWVVTYRSSVLPFLSANRLPPVGPGARAVYPL